MARRQGSFVVLFLALTGCCFLTVGLNFFHGSVFHLKQEHVQLIDEIRGRSAKARLHLHHHGSKQSGVALPNRAVTTKHNNHSLAGLSCEAYGGPEDPSEMVYWRDIPSDATNVSPFRSNKTEQYLTFEPDGGGWNNIRMSMETVMALAHAMGRTLVLPPEQQMYLLASATKKQKNAFSFMDFFHMDTIAAEHPGLKIITMEEFLEKEGLAGNLGPGVFPPNKRTNWNGRSREVNNELNPWLRSVAVMPDWDPNICLAAFPEAPGKAAVLELQSLFESVLTNGVAPDYREFIGHPTPVDASARDRLREAAAGRARICVYDETLQGAKLIHFHGKQGIGARLLVHFYAFLFFGSWRQDLWTKRFVRDHVRYVDELQCAAGRIVQALRKRARSRQPTTNPDGAFDTLHIRRGDFQYKKTRVDASDIYERSKDTLTEGSTVYIATDERDKSFFDAMKEHYDVAFLDDYLYLIPDLNTNYYGMVDQLIAAQGRYFFGCWFSTFTGYINRIRGYIAVKKSLEGSENGIIDSYYYAMAEHKNRMREYHPVKRAFYAREFPVSWRDIDKDVNQ